jgi:hypothetical protein
MNYALFMSDKPAPPKERRDFFRVSDEVLFDFKIIDSYTAENSDPESEFADATALHLLNELRRLDKDNAQILKMLAEKNRLLGDFLHSLSSKIDLIARHTLFVQSEKESRPTERINLSEDGIAFVSNRAIYKGNYLVMRLIFLPHYVPVIVFGQVVRCESKSNLHQVAARFFRANDSTRQELSRQILKAQVAQKKERLADKLKK